jgi:hypothetical protein
MEQRRRQDPFNPQRPAEPLNVTERLLDLVALLQPPYELLPTDYILKRMGSYGKPLMATANAYGLIRIPDWPEARTMGARNRQAVWQITAEGEALLARYERHSFVERESDQNPHKYGRAIIQFSFDQAPFEIDGLEMRGIADILAHGNCPPATRDEKHPSWVPLRGNYCIISDGQLFGYAYALPSGKKRYLYLHGFEFDRGTETITGENRKTLEGMIKDYALYLDPKSPFSYRKRYGLSNCLVPIVTTKAERANNILALIERLAPHVAHKFIIKVMPDFGATKPCTECRPSTRAMCEACKGTNRVPVPCPPPTAHMLTEDWMQCGGKTLNLLSDILMKGEDGGLSKESRTGERACA